MSDMKQIFGSDSENEENNSTEQNEQEAEYQEEEVEEAQAEEEENGEESEVREADAEETEEQEVGSPADAAASPADAADAEDEEERQAGSNDEENEEQQENDDDDDDEVVRPKKDPKTAEVFGDELADLSESDSNKEAGEDEEEHDENRRASQNLEENEEEEEPEQVIDIEIPRVKTDLGKEIQFIKLPNFLSVDPRPFDPETYEDENPKGEALDEEGKTRVRLKVENTIRWRYEKDEEGNLVKQSNAKFVKWSDGSLSLHLGNEIFDVSKLAMHGDHNHLFVRQGNVLQGQAVFRTKLSFRPHSTDSMTHRKMTMSLVDHGSRTKKVKIITEMKLNPESNRVELMKKEEEKLRAASRRQNQQRRMREKSHQKGLSANYLEDRYNSEDDDNGISLSAIKNRFKNRNDTIDSSSDESDRERRLNKAKNDDDDEDDDEYGEDDDDIDSGKHATASAQKKKKKMVVSDDEE